MAERSKRKRGEGEQVISTTDGLLEVLNTITTEDSAEIAILHLMNEYSFSLSTLQQVLLGVSPFIFSYKQF